MTHRERLEKAIENMEKTSVCLDVFDRAIEAAKREVWDGLKMDNSTLRWALKELGPTGTNAEAYIKATVEYVIACREQKEHP